MIVVPEATEAWIELHIDGLKSKAVYVVKRGDITLFEGKLANADTTLNDTGLEPLTSYTYKSYAKASGEKSPKESQTITTMDTTSHDISWERLEWGDVGSSYFRGVHIINENDIWAVGELFIWHEDSADYTKYNAVHWDGREWSFLNVPGRLSTGALLNFVRMQAVFAFDSSNVWMFSGSGSYSKKNRYWLDYSVHD